MNPVYFCDRNLGKKFGLRLRGLGLEATLHDERFPQDYPDEKLIPDVAKDFILLTLDENLRYRPVERAAILRYKAQVIFLPNPKQRHKDWLLEVADEFFQAQPKLRAFLSRNAPPFAARFHIDPKKMGGKRYFFSLLKL